MNIYIIDKKEDLENGINFFVKDIKSLRTGRASTSILDIVQVESYGVKNPINAVANISINNDNSILISPWDKNVIKEIEKAIVNSNLGLGVVNEGDKIRLTIPKITEENRLSLVKELNEKQEKARIIIRKVRDEIKTNIEKAEKSKEIGEDEKFQFIKELDEEIKRKNTELQEIRDKKEKEIMTI